MFHVQKPNRQVGILRRLSNMFKYDGVVGAMKPSWTLGSGVDFNVPCGDCGVNVGVHTLGIVTDLHA
jgi:hypothetical protein